MGHPDVTLYGTIELTSSSDIELDGANESYAGFTNAQTADAAATASLTKAQILQQAGVAMLAQAGPGQPVAADST